MANKFKSQLDNMKQQRHLMLGVVFLFIIVIFWTGLSIFSSQHKVAISQELKDLSKSLVPSVDQETISKLEQKRVYSDDELAEFPIYKMVVSKDGKDVKLIEIEVDEEAIFVSPTPKPKPTEIPAEDTEFQGSGEDEDVDFYDGFLTE